MVLITSTKNLIVIGHAHGTETDFSYRIKCERNELIRSERNSVCMCINQLNNVKFVRFQLGKKRAIGDERLCIRNNNNNNNTHNKTKFVVLDPFMVSKSMLNSDCDE